MEFITKYTTAAIFNLLLLNSKGYENFFPMIFISFSHQMPSHEKVYQRAFVSKKPNTVQEERFVQFFNANFLNTKNEVDIYVGELGLPFS